MRDHTDIHAAPPLPTGLRAALAAKRRQDPQQGVPRDAADCEAALLAALATIAGRRDEGAAELARATLDRIEPYLAARRRAERGPSEVPGRVRRCVLLSKSGRVVWPLPAEGL